MSKVNLNHFKQVQKDHQVQKSQQSQKGHRVQKGQQSQKGHRVQKSQQSQKDHRVQKEHQVEQDSTFDDYKDKLIAETQSFMYSQSKSFSSVARTLILGIIATIWLFIFSNNSCSINNKDSLLLVSLCFCIVYLFIDVVHYLWDSIDYQRELYRLDEYETEAEIETRHEPKMDKINQRSHRFIWYKFVSLVVASVLFIIDIICRLFA